MKQISKGAEAEIYLDKDKVIKSRIKKNYRIEDIDKKLRKSRTSREAKILQKVPNGVRAPKFISTSGTDISMEFIKGEKVRDILDNNVKLCEEIGKKVAILHNSGIIHGDLTTSNMIYLKEIYMIDFGLSYFSDKIEDKAVDLHLVKQALESKHYKIANKAFELIIKGYKKESKNFDNIIQRFVKVETRGRNKGKY